MKQRRAALVAIIGITLLAPCAVTLRSMAADGDFGTTFAVIQSLELAGGLINLILLSLNARAGGRLSTVPPRRMAHAAAPPA